MASNGGLDDPLPSWKTGMLAGTHKERMRASEVASLLGISERTLSRWVASGRFPKPSTFGKVRQWNSVVVNSWIESAESGGFA